MIMTFNELAEAASKILEALERIETRLSKDLPKETASQETWFDLQGLRDYLPNKPAESTIYRYVSLNLIPFHKGPKLLRFLKSEIDEWLKAGGATSKQAPIDAYSYLKINRK
jgi:hypothetical protein